MGDEFDVDQPAGDELEVPRVLVALLARDQVAHRLHVLGEFGLVARLGEHGGDRRGDLLAEPLVAGDDAGARQRQMLPGFRLVGLVEAEGRNWVARGPLPPDGRSLKSTS